MKRAKLHKIYLETRELIAKPNQWCKGNFHVVTTDGEKFCLVGALRQKIADPDLVHSAHALIGECITKHFPKRGSTSLYGATIVEFNDNYLAKIHPEGKLLRDMDAADGWPRYYFSLDVAKQEVVSWMLKRGQLVLLG